MVIPAVTKISPCHLTLYLLQTVLLAALKSDYVTSSAPLKFLSFKVCFFVKQKQLRYLMHALFVYRLSGQRKAGRCTVQHRMLMVAASVRWWRQNRACVPEMPKADSSASYWRRCMCTTLTRTHNVSISTQKPIYIKIWFG